MFAETLKNNPRQLILMRHGEAAGSPDIDRQLTLQGKSQSRAVAKTLVSLECLPDIIICSDVERTRQTLTEMNLPKHIPTIFCGQDLYNANSYKDILNVIADLMPADKDCPLIIGHNPAIHETVLHLSKESRGPKFKNIEMSYPSGTTSIFEFTSDDWNILHPSTCRLTHIISSL